MSNNTESDRTVLVRPIGMVGDGKSSLLNAIAGYKVPHPKIPNKMITKQFFACGTSAAGIKVSMGTEVPVNPEVLREGESMILRDAEGIASSADDSVKVFDALLESLKKDKQPATLLVLLSRCTSLSSDNCVLVLTHASDPDNFIPASQADPSSWIQEVHAKTGLDCFVKDSNVFCIDYDDEDYREKTVTRVREALITKMPVTAHTTHAELLGAAAELSTSSEAARKIAQAKLDVMQSDLAWHQRRSKDLSIAIPCTIWVPFAGWISAGGMAIAVADSDKKANRLRADIPEVEKLVDDAKAAKAAAVADVETINKYL